MKTIRENSRKGSALIFMSVMFASLIAISSLGSKAAGAQTAEGCTELPLSRVSANFERSGSEANKAVDSDPNTRWTSEKQGAYIQADLGSSAIVCSIDISWFSGDSRSYDFVISVSNDGQNFRDIVSGKSTGTTTMPERYNIPDTGARYLRVTVNGNTENNFASIYELSVNGRACSPPQISRIGASGSQQPNIPQNTLDNNLNTRWSNLGFPSWIQYDMGESQPICNVDIAWYRGNLRVNIFTISVSDDGINFTPIFSGKSSGETTGLESYNVPDTVGQYMRITVTGNSENSWSSITEVNINGESQAPTPSEICGNNQDDDGDGQTDEGCQTGGSGADPFGIEEIYPTKPGSEDDEWFMDMSDGQDPRSRPPSMTKNSDGSFKVTSGQVRYGVFTTSGYNPDDIELDHGVLAERGYMQSPNDWKDVELTGYVKVNSGQSDENFAWYARGGRHTGSGAPEGCEGSSIKADLGYDGRVRFAKEQWHVSYVFTDHKRAMSSIEDRWVGFKGIMYNIEQNGETALKMEIWVDKNEDGNEDGPWEKVDENIDAGGWGDEGEECGGEPDQIITWGGPIATFRWDGASNVDIKNFSVREIQAPSQ
jgi:F5/8 type C domain